MLQAVVKIQRPLWMWFSFAFSPLRKQKWAKFEVNAYLIIVTTNQIQTYSKKPAFLKLKAPKTWFIGVFFFLNGVISPNIPKSRLCQIKVTSEEICPLSLAKYGDWRTLNLQYKHALACTANKNLHFEDCTSVTTRGQWSNKMFPYSTAYTHLCLSEEDWWEYCIGAGEVCG